MLFRVPWNLSISTTGRWYYLNKFNLIAIAQCVIYYLVAILFGLPATISIVYEILMVTPFAIFHIALGLLCGSILNVKQVGGICGVLLTNLSA